LPRLSNRRVVPPAYTDFLMNRTYRAVVILAALSLSGRVDARTRVVTGSREVHVTMQARGSFEVKLNPQGPDETVQGVSVGRSSIEKLFDGDLKGTSKGEMLTGMRNEKGSGVYVAIERVTGTLHGHSGTFVLAHRGTMTRGAQELVITIVPDSGTHELVGIAGSMTITITGREHFYVLEYTLPESR